jgi:hypothetical protein
MQRLIQVTNQRGERGVIGKPLKKLADIRHPKGRLKTRPDFLESLPETQIASLPAVPQAPRG